ncbi:MAG: aminotransferase class III-fold pyridoxal phosphate-dependent enzyme, partial [Myxococcota bacterium]|nr:aminotransferase class III-fold pyridoxal phosphate-dependent enzyme [Myxococcota bacterium]
LALVLIRPDLDVWAPGEHNGTFRGHNPAFVTATAALDFWTTDALTREVRSKGAMVRGFLEDLAGKYQGLCAEVRGEGLIQGLDCPPPGAAEAICRRAFQHGLIAETAGAESNVVKVMPPLVVDTGVLREGLGILARAVEEEAAVRSTSGSSDRAA